MGMGFPAERTHFPGAHKIGVAISGPRLAGKTFYGHEDFSECSLFIFLGNGRRRHYERGLRLFAPEESPKSLKIFSREWSDSPLLPTLKNL